MKSQTSRLLSTLFLFPKNLNVQHIHITARCVVISLACRSETAACPTCGGPSERVHGRYDRTISDVPCAGRRVLLRLSVRKFVCTTPMCSQRIFTERLPELVQPYARMTTRLLALIQAIGLATSGELGARLAGREGIVISASGVLRYLMKLPPPAAQPAVRVLGVDDWSWKKGRRYGTILVDLQRHRVIDLLPDRQADTLAQWLRAHPGVRIISRDRSTDYAAAIRQAAPHALQVADRFHLVRNLAEALERLLARCRAEIRQAEYSGEAVGPPPEDKLRTLPAPEHWHPHHQANVDRLFEARQAQRDDRFAQAMSLRAQGLSTVEIARRLGKSERAVRGWFQRGEAPTYKRGRKRWSPFDPFAVYALERWQAGEHNGKQIYAEIRVQGYRGTLRTVQRFLQVLREQRRPVINLPPPSIAERFSAHAAVWLFIRKQESLTEKEREDLALIRQSSATAEAAYALVQDFLHLLRTRQGKRLVSWIQAVERSQLPELQRFVAGLLQDRDAVVAGLTRSYSNAQTEGQVHRLKLLKRQMFGRAKLPLLKQRLLHSF